MLSTMRLAIIMSAVMILTIWAFVTQFGWIMVSPAWGIGTGIVMGCLVLPALAAIYSIWKQYR